MGSMSAQAAQTTSALSKLHTGKLQDAVCDGVCEAHAGQSRRCVKRAVIDSLRDTDGTVNETLMSAPFQ